MTYNGETTELKFKKYCNSKDIWSLKIRIPLDLDTLNVNKAMAQPSDYIVVLKDKVLFVEIKEILYNNSFPLSRLTQEFKLHKLSLINEKCLGMVLLNFVSEDKLVYMDIFNYIKISKNIGKKSIRLDEFPDEFVFSWRNLIL